MLRLRPHHLLCLTHFVGEGYSGPFVENMTQILKRLRDGEPLRLQNGCDDICAHCPRRNDGICESEVFVAAIDARVAARLTFPPDTPVTWEQAQSQILPLCRDMENICGGCEWRTLCAENNLR